MYNNCLRVLIVDTLKIRRLEADLFFYYKIFHKLVDLEDLLIFSFVITRILVATILRLLEDYFKVTCALIFFVIVQCLFGMTCQMNGFHVTVV